MRLVGKTMVIYNKHGLGCVWRNLQLHKMSRVSIRLGQHWAGLISEGPETQSGAVPELIKEAWCREPVKMWLCDMIWWCSFLSAWSVSVAGRQSDWHLGTGILETRFKVPSFKNLMEIGCSVVISQFHPSSAFWCFLFVCDSEVQDLHLSPFLIFKDGTAQWRMKNYGTAHFRGQSWRNIISWHLQVKFKYCIFRLSHARACYIFSHFIMTRAWIAEKGIQGDSGDAWKQIWKNP